MDFKRPKVKVGKKLKPRNATDTSFTARAVRDAVRIASKRRVNW